MKFSGCFPCFPSISTKVGYLSKNFPKDSKVEISGLTTNSEHNGKTGIVVGYANDNNRIYVMIEGDSKTLSLKPTNLKLVSDESPTTTNPSTADPGALTHSSSAHKSLQLHRYHHANDRASAEEAPKNSSPASELTIINS